MNKFLEFLKEDVYQGRPPMLLPLRKKIQESFLTKAESFPASACPVLALLMTSQWISRTFPLIYSPSQLQMFFGHRHHFKNLSYGSINKENHLPEWWKKQEVSTLRRRHCLSTVFLSALASMHSTSCYIIFYKMPNWTESEGQYLCRVWNKACLIFSH